MKKCSGLLRRTAALLLAAFVLSAACAAAAEENAEKGETYMFEDSIPEKYLVGRKDGGRIERITYPSSDYFGDGADVEKPALIYFPANYSEDVPCDILILCHGVGGTEEEWSRAAGNKFKAIADGLFAEGDVKNLLIVMPNGRSSASYANTDFSNMQTFYPFGQELRNDLIPYLDSHYNTYADRDHRAMAGLSMGGMQTINIGLCECLDLISAFGAFSAAPTSYTSAEIAKKLQAFPEDLDIRYFYNVCGTEDTIAYSSAAAAAKKMPADSRLSEANYCWQERPGNHYFDIWNLGLYNFVKLLGSLQE